MITTAHVQHLRDVAGRYMDPVLIRFDDTNTITVIPSPHLTDVSWSERGRPVTRLATLADLPDNPTDEDCRALADMLNEGAE